MLLVAGLARFNLVARPPLRYVNVAWHGSHNLRTLPGIDATRNSISCPGLPGCWSQGQTEHEALENIQYAIREYFAAVAMISKGSRIREVEVLV